MDPRLELALELALVIVPFVTVAFIACVSAIALKRRIVRRSLRNSLSEITARLIVPAVVDNVFRSTSLFHRLTGRRSVEPADESESPGARKCELPPLGTCTLCGRVTESPCDACGSVIFDPPLPPAHASGLGSTGFSPTGTNYSEMTLSQLRSLVEMTPDDGGPTYIPYAAFMRLWDLLAPWPRYHIEAFTHLDHVAFCGRAVAPRA